MHHTYSTIRLENDHKAIVRIILNRPDKLNALNQQVLNELEHVITNLDTTQIRGIIISGEGKAFCAGADIKELAMLDGVTGIKFAEKGQHVFNLLEQLPIPTIAAVNGFAFGGGCELAQAATLRIASKDAKFGQPEVKLGVIPGFGGTQRLARLIGKGRALELCLTAKIINADTALQWGLVNEMVEPEKLLITAQSIMESMLELSSFALSQVLGAIHHGFNLSLSDALHLERVSFGMICSSSEKEEGVKAFLEKRKPNFNRS